MAAAMNQSLTTRDRIHHDFAQFVGHMETQFSNSDQPLDYQIRKKAEDQKRAKREFPLRWCHLLISTLTLMWVSNVLLPNCFSTMNSSVQPRVMSSRESLDSPVLEEAKIAPCQS